MVTVDDGHGISQPKREAAVSWFRRWLCNDPSPVIERDIAVVPKEMLHCTNYSQVNQEFPKEVNDFARARILADSFAVKRASRTNLIPDMVKQVINIEKYPSSIDVQRVGIIRKTNVEFEAVVLRRGGIPVPVLSVYSAYDPKEVVLWLHGEGKGNLADSTAFISRYLAEGKVIVLADISGVGELADQKGANDPKYYNIEYRNAMLAMHIGTSLPALRTADILSVTEFIATSPRTKGLPLTVYATGVCALPALHAAIADERITMLKTGSTISSFYEILDKPAEKDWYSYVMPGVLQWYDIPDLTNYLGDRFAQLP